MVTPLSDDYLFRFGGIGRLYGEASLQRFAQAHIAIIGLGGVGAWAAEALARSGIGHLTLIDLDDVCTSNINRQIHALSSSVGRSKIQVMAERIAEINPQCQVHCQHTFIRAENLQDLLGDGFDYVIDAIDSVPAKTALLAWCRRHKQKVICIGGAGGQTDPTRIQTADLTRVHQDPLLAKVRNRLRREYHFSRNPKRRFDLECVFSDQAPVYPTTEGTVCQQRPKAQAHEPMRLDCRSGFGAASFVTASFAFVAVSRVLSKLTQK